MKKYISLFIIVLCGCQLVVDVDVPYDEGLTLNSYFTPDSLWQVKLTANRHVLDETDFQNIETGTIIIYDGDQPIETLRHTGNGVYKSATTKPLIGKVYKISATDKKSGAVTSTSTIPTPAKISSLTFDKEPGPFGVPPSLKMKLEFQDLKYISNYYQITVNSGLFFWDPTTKKDFILWFPMHLESDNPIVKTENRAATDEFLFKDIAFDGKAVNLTFNASGPSNFPILRVTLKTLSEDYFKYASTYRLQRSTSGDPFAQPTNVHNNIQNGFGIFAGYSESIFEYSLPKPVITEISPVLGRVGDRITISGKNFPTGDNFQVVQFNGSPNRVAAPLITGTETKMELIVPQGAISGLVTIFTDAGTAISPVDFQVIK
jgi:hypothetical protein